MAEDATKKKTTTTTDSGTVGLIPKGGLTTPKGTDTPTTGGTGALGLGANSPGAGDNPFTGGTDVTTSTLDSTTVPLTGGQEDTLGLGALFGNTKPETIGSYRSAVANMSPAQLQSLGNILSDAGVMAAKTTPYTVAEIQTDLVSALTHSLEGSANAPTGDTVTPTLDPLQPGSAIAKSPTPTLTEYLTDQIAQRSTSTSAADTGGVNELVSSMQTIADDYQIPGSSAGLTAQAQQYLNQGLTLAEAEANYKQSAQAQAAGLYPNFAPQIESGVTTKTLLDPYAAMAAQVLGFGTTATGTSGAASADDVTDAEASLGINWASPKWSVALSGGTNPANGGPTPMSLDQWRQTLVTNPVYGWANTSDAKDIADTVGNKLLETFGIIPSSTV